MSRPNNVASHSLVILIGLLFTVNCSQDSPADDDGGQPEGDTATSDTANGDSGQDTSLGNDTDSAPFVPSPGVMATQKGTITSIDGLLTEALWDISTPVSHTIEGTGNNHILFGTRWDDYYLYVGVQVTDPNRHNDSLLTWQDDSVEVYLDGDFSRGRVYDEHDVQYWLEYDSNELTVTYGMPLNAKHAITSTENGYAAELAILWADIQITPSAGMRIGFDLGINDDDDGNDRDAHHMWNGNDNNWTDTSAFGTLILQ